MEVIPVVPENLSLILESQEKYRKDHLNEIGNHPEWQGHIKLVHDSINIIHLIGIERKPKNEDELVLLAPGALLFNNCLTTYSLILSGFYRTALMPLRDMFECSLLLEKFTLERSAIQRWKNVKIDKPEEEFKPYAVRNFLQEKKSNYPPNQPKITYMYHVRIEDMYRNLCVLGAHPTYIGVAKMLCKNKLLNSGPFLDPDKLEIVLIEFARVGAFSAGCLLDAFGLENIESRLQPTIFDFKKSSHIWFTKHGSFT